MASSANALPPVISDMDFCPWCGSILPLAAIYETEVKCQRCQFVRKVEEYKKEAQEIILPFNAKKERKIPEMGASEENEDALKGPTVERECPRCKHDVMTYTTRQTRGADEGQTVFYTCLKCNLQDIEYS